MVRYLDSSVVLSEILAEGRRPAADFWSARLTSSRLLSIEVWTRLQAYGVRETHADIANRILDAIEILEMDLPVIERAHEPFPNPIRALDAIHLSSASYLRDQGEEIEIATYDTRMRATARALGFEIYPLEEG